MSRWGSGVGLALVAAASVGVWQLFRIEKEARPDEEAVDVVPEVSVRTCRVVLTNLHVTASGYGTVVPTPVSAPTPASARILAPAAGRIDSVSCSLGGSVRAGETLFRMDGRFAELNVEKARQGVTFAEQGVARQRKLQQMDATTERQVLEAQQLLASAQQELRVALSEKELLALASPLAGTIIALKAKAGERVEAGQEVAEVADLHRLAARVPLPSRCAETLRQGMAATVQADGGAPCACAVGHIGSSANPETDAVDVFLDLPADAALRPGQFVRACIVVQELRERLAVPESCLERTEDGRSAVRLAENGVALLRPVETGVREGDWVEVRGEGLAAGALIVSDGGYGLPDRTRIRISTE